MFQVRLQLFVLCFLFLNTVLAQANTGDSTFVYGNAPQYAGLHLTIEYQSDFISHENSPLITFTVKPNGDFRASFILGNTTKVSMKLGKSVGTALLQPKGEFQLILPPYTPIEEADQMNPFFVPDYIPLAIIKGDRDNLNQLISEFDDEFNSIYVSNVRQLFKKESEVPIKHLIQRLDSIFPSKNPWFIEYKHYSYFKFYDLTFQRRKEYVVEKFFKNSTFAPYNSAYCEAFNSTFYRYFAFLFSLKNNDVLQKAWASRSLDSISSALKSSTMLKDDNLREAVILKNLYDAYYSNLYDKGEILTLIEQAQVKFTTALNKSIASNICVTLNQLKEGSPAPSFDLDNFEDKSKTLKKYRGKFVYLNFVQTENYACKKDLLSLVAINNATKKDLEIVTIVTDKNNGRAKEFIKKNKLQWDFLSIQKQESLKVDYRIKFLPTYFLIDPNGNILLAPAPSPEENFLTVFEEQARVFRNKDLRKNPPKQKSIFEM